MKLRSVATALLYILKKPIAAAHQGAGILECDVTFTKDGKPVCRHAQCDLHKTTNILVTDLSDTCVKQFEPAEFDPISGGRTKAASAEGSRKNNFPPLGVEAPAGQGARSARRR